jgi:hypothetical protein
VGHPGVSSDARPAFYALRPGGWRDYLTLLHPPYTLWHLSYVAIGAALAPQMKWGTLGWTELAFFLALGIGAHALDELSGRPLQTQIPRVLLVVLAAMSIGAAGAIGIVVASHSTWWLLVFVAVGAFIVVAYNLELFGGRLHTDAGFALSWGAFPVLTAYAAQADGLGVAAVLGAAAAFTLSYAQRALSTPARLLRRRVRRAEGDLTLSDGSVLPLDAPTLLRPLERSLRALSSTVVLLAAAMVTARLW